MDFESIEKIDDKNIMELYEDTIEYSNDEALLAVNYCACWRARGFTFFCWAIGCNQWTGTAATCQSFCASKGGSGSIWGNCDTWGTCK